jgi:hypothetical protein
MSTSGCRVRLALSATAACLLAAGLAGATAPVQETDGVPCDPGRLHQYASGRLQDCTLARDAAVRGVLLPARTVVALEEDGGLRFVFLPRTVTFEGHACRGEGHDYMTRFHPNGRLRLCWLEHDETIQDVPCSRFTWMRDVFGRPSGVEFADDGRLTGCRLSRDIVRDGQAFQKGRRVGIDTTGRLREHEWGTGVPTAPRE